MHSRAQVCKFSFEDRYSAIKALLDRLPVALLFMITDLSLKPLCIRRTNSSYDLSYWWWPHTTLRKSSFENAHLQHCALNCVPVCRMEHTVNYQVGGVSRCSSSYRYLQFSAFSGSRNRDLYPTTLVLSHFSYDGYAAVARKILDTYQWTSVCYLWDTSLQIPFEPNVYFRVNAHLRGNPKYQMVGFPHNASRAIDYDAVLSSVASTCRSNMRLPKFPVAFVCVELSQVIYLQLF